VVGLLTVVVQWFCLKGARRGSRFHDISLSLASVVREARSHSRDHAHGITVQRISRALSARSTPCLDSLETVARSFSQRLRGNKRLRERDIRYKSTISNPSDSICITSCKSYAYCQLQQDRWTQHSLQQHHRSSRSSLYNIRSLPVDPQVPCPEQSQSIYASPTLLDDVRSRTSQSSEKLSEKMYALEALLRIYANNH